MPNGIADTQNESEKKELKVLLVEDNPGDARLTKEAFREYGARIRLFHVIDGEYAMAFLRNPTAETPRPDIILLDLNLPGKDGREVLAEVKADENLRTIPVAVLTTSKAEQDILKSYDLHANCYLTKPVDFDEFSNLVHSLGQFWLSSVQLP
jgi:CheY-like chemotaxis protein